MFKGAIPFEEGICGYPRSVQEPKAKKNSPKKHDENEKDDENDEPRSLGMPVAQRRNIISPPRKWWVNWQHDRSPFRDDTSGDTQPRIPILRPTFSSTSRACSNSSFVCIAVMMVRMRALPSGTVG